MSDEQDKLKVSLEPPKLFGRKKKPAASSTRRAPAPAPEPAPEDEVDEATTVEEVEETTPQVAPVAEEPVEEPVAEAPAEEPVDEPAAEAPAVEETAVEEPGTVDPPAEETSDDTAVIPVAEDEPTVAPRKTAPVTKTVPAAMQSPAAAPASAAAPAPVAKPAPKKAAKKTAPVEEKVPAAKSAAAPAAKKSSRPRAKLAPPIEPEPVRPTEIEDASITSADEPPLLDMYPAAAVTGVVVGAALVLLTWLSLRGCEAVRGTATCTGGPGLLLLVATFVLSILLGSTLLKVFQIPDPGSSSFLAVGLVAVVALLFLIDALDHWSMIIVIPVLSVGAYLASVWVTKTFVETDSTST
ncbi:hypothetical protein [Nocardioides sp. MH1]|uniref:hypothetical protein n=1 Tax=Nocardioides sp. MH1 TaxID=3242490 RepID=UPI0035207F2C